MSLCVVDGGHCCCNPGMGTQCPGVVALRARVAELESPRVERVPFKDAWEEFQGDFYKAADLDKVYGGAYIISDADWAHLLRKVNAVIGAESRASNERDPLDDTNHCGHLPGERRAAEPVEEMREALVLWMRWYEADEGPDVKLIAEAVDATKSILAGHAPKMDMQDGYVGSMAERSQLREAILAGIGAINAGHHERAAAILREGLASAPKEPVL